ncbi:MAG: ATP-binding cassette domain-containing protein [Chitinophagaceae bacterium]|nr:MAG: ATP-binding cassette domain-containing protein [Chitinophagaceae bacterium]
MLEVQNLQYQIGKQAILNDISVQFQPGLCHLIVGPNGSGKSTFIKIVSAEIEAYQGKVLYEGKDAKKITKQNLSQYRAVLSQHKGFIRHITTIGYLFVKLFSPCIRMSALPVAALVC